MLKCRRKPELLWLNKVLKGTQREGRVSKRVCVLMIAKRGGKATLLSNPRGILKREQLRKRRIKKLNKLHFPQLSRK